MRFSSSSPKLRGLTHLIDSLSFICSNSMSGQAKKDVLEAWFFDLNRFDPSGEFRDQPWNEFGSAVHLEMDLAVDSLRVDLVGTPEVFKKAVVAADNDLVAADHSLQVQWRIDCLDFPMIDDCDLVTVFGLFHVVCRHEDG